MKVVGILNRWMVSLCLESNERQEKDSSCYKRVVSSPSSIVCQFRIPVSQFSALSVGMWHRNKGSGRVVGGPGMCGQLGLAAACPPPLPIGM